MVRNKLGIVLIAGAALTMGGCSTIQTDLKAIGSGVSIATASITNPVTKTREAQIELAVDAAVSVMKAYKKACKDGAADKSCAANVAAVQAYTRQMTPLLVRLRSFVDSNDQVNAIVIYNQLIGLYADFKTSATNLGYNIGSLP